jgi:hypothetical protein
MRVLSEQELGDVAGGWGCWSWFRWCAPKRNYCQPKPVCKPKPVCDPKPKCEPKPPCDPNEDIQEF